MGTITCYCRGSFRNIYPRIQGGGGGGGGGGQNEYLFKKGGGGGQSCISAGRFTCDSRGG